MIVVYVKHYLNVAGRDYFDAHWFPHVLSIITKQHGFVDIDTSRDEHDRECINITVKFTSSETLDTWVKNDLHQKVINDLDIYRTRGQRWYVSDGRVLPPLGLDEWAGEDSLVQNFSNSKSN